jgi:hypothetical protein
MGAPRPTRADVIATVAGVLAAIAGTWGVKVSLTRWRADQAIAQLTWTWQVDSETKQRLGRAFEREMRPLLARPDVGRMAPLWKAFPLWLSDADMATYQSLRKRAAFASERACPCFVDDRACSQSDKLYGQAALSDDDLALWFRLEARSVQARLDGAEAVPFDKREFDAGMEVILRGMSDADRARFTAAAQGRATRPADLCAAARALFTGIEKLEPARQGRFTRAMLSAGAGR